MLAFPTIPRSQRWTQTFKAPGAGDLAITLLIVSMISFIGNYNFMCNHFYVNGAYVHDTGWYSGLLYRNGLLLRDPLVITSYQPSAIYNLRTHFSPGLFLFSIPSRFLPISPIQNASIFFSFIYASLGSAAATAAFHCTAGYGRATRIASSSCLGLALVLSGPVVAAVGFPHAEYLFDTGAILFFFFLFTGRPWLASLVFGFTVLMREDFGLHLSGLCIALMLYRIACGHELWRAQRMIAWFASAGVAWSLLAIAVQKLFFPGDDTLTRIYLGSPAFGHLTQGFLRHRIADFITNRPDLVTDVGVAALAPNSVAPSQQFDKHKENGARINGIVFFLHSFNGLQALRFAIANRFDYFVHIGNTNVYVAVSRLSDSLKTALGAFDAEEEAPFIRLLPVGPAGLAIEKGKAIQSTEQGLAAFGPYLTLPNGSYRATYSFEFRNPFCHSLLRDTQLDVGIFVHDVMAEPTRSRVEDLAPLPTRDGCRLNHTRDFDISSPSGSAVPELPVWHGSTDRGSIVDLRIALRNAR